MVSPEAAVLFRATTKFRIGGEEDALAEPVAGEIVVERCDRARELGEQRAVASLLLRMRVESAVRDKEDAGAEVGRDQLRDRLEFGGQRAIRVIGVGFVTSL